MNKKYYRNILILVVFLFIIIFNQGCNLLNNPFLESDLNSNGTYTSIFEDLNLPKDYELRIVLSWGIAPVDLDSHLTVPNSDGSRFHCFWSNKGYQDIDPFALLDIDDLDSYGPEITTIYKINSGIYRYSVHDYTNRLSTSSTELSTSNAVIKVYQQINKKDILLYDFTVPNAPGTLWTVFEYDGTNFTPINIMTFESNWVLIN